METHVKVLGVLNIVYGALGLCGALLLMVIFGGVMGIVGAEGQEEAAIALPIIGVTGMALVVLLVATSLPLVIIGYGLFKQRSWSRVAGIVISIINLISVPLGTALGIYGLWVLFSKDGQSFFDALNTTRA